MAKKTMVTTGTMITTGTCNLAGKRRERDLPFLYSENNGEKGERWEENDIFAIETAIDDQKMKPNKRGKNPWLKGAEQQSQPPFP